MNKETLKQTENLEDLKIIALNLFEENRILQEQVKFLQDKIFGRRSEKKDKDDGQLSLFDIPEPELSLLEQPEEIVIASHTRKKKGRKALPADLPRVDVVHDLDDEEKQCECGAEKECIGREVSEQLEYIPAKLRVIRNIRYKYACKNCEGVEDENPTVAIARMPDQIIPKSIATPGLLAHILTAKFTDALPFYRQEKQFSRLGIELPRATMCNWAIKVAEACDILLDIMQDEILKGPLINIDETTLKVLKSPRKSKSYVWVFRGGPPDKPIVLFQYHPTRSGDVAMNFLKGYEGIVQTDGYGGYDFLDKNTNIIHAACWVHARRKFKAVTKVAGNRNNPSGNAGTALKYISKLYKIEKKARQENISVTELYERRQASAVPILDEFKKWLDHRVEKVPPKSLLGKAIHYTLNQWNRLIQYTKDGIIKPDNNLVENAIRPFVVGRKNWLFSGSPRGAHASAMLYSLIETAKANGLEPYWYLRHLFTKLPEAMTTQDFTALTPQHIDKAALENLSISF